MWKDCKRKPVPEVETPVCITGMGVLSPCGNTPDSLVDALLAGRSGVTLYPGDESLGLAPAVVGALQEIPEWGLSKPQQASLDRCSRLALAAAHQAMGDAGLSLSGDQGLQAGIAWGTGMGGIHSLEDAYRQLFERQSRRLRPLTVVMAMHNAAAAHIAMAHGLRGPSVTFSNACASSAMAIGEGARWIRQGLAEVVLVGGADAPLTPATLRAWQAMATLATPDPAAPQTSCRPFAADRSGLVLAEGAGALVLESQAHARARGARIHGELLGYGSSCDASHLSHPAVDGQVRAMTQALAEAGLGPEAVGYVNAHGTATRVGDQVEAAAIAQVLGCRVPVSSTKALHGHCMGATGAVEFIASLTALARGRLLPAWHREQADPACDLAWVAPESRQAPASSVFLSNSFAFGGSNGVLVARAGAGDSAASL